MSRALLLVALLIVFTGCARRAAAPTQPQIKVVQTGNDEEDVYEAVFRDMIGFRYPDQPAPDACFFLEVEDKALPAEFLARFAGMKELVKPLSAATVNQRGHAVDAETGKRGIRLNAGAISWGDNRKATVLSDYLARPEGENLGVSYTIELRDGHWIVTSNGILYAN